MNIELECDATCCGSFCRMLGKLKKKKKNIKKAACVTTGRALFWVS